MRVVRKNQRENIKMVKRMGSGFGGIKILKKKERQNIKMVS